MFENNPVVELAVGRSSVRQRILALLIDDSAGRLHLREIQRRAVTSPGTASRELAKLVAAGLIVREAEGNQVYFRASTSPFAAMLRTLLVAIPAPDVGPRPPRLPRTKPGPSAAALATQPAPAEAEAGAGALTLDTAQRAITPAARETQATHGPAAPDTARRVIRPDAAAKGRTEPATGNATSRASASPATPDPLGLEVAGRLAESIRSMYREAVRGVYLCGVRAFGPAPADADVETIIVLDHVDQYGAELERTSHLCAAMSHALNLVVSRIFVSEADWNGGSEGALPQARAEAVAV